MNPGPTDISALSDLLDQGFERLDQGLPLDPWLAALPPARAPLLREMLDEHRDARHAAFMAAGPRLDEPGGLPGAAPGDTVGPYRLLRELGRGGMAVVWLAERHDGTLQRQVALKMPLLTLDSEAQVQRFERERDALARLAHPHIARLYDAGVTADRRPYIVLEAIDGQPITTACAQRGLDLRARLQLFLQVLDAVDHAHRHLVVHRDIKPSNVFVDRAGQVRLLDFGVAKLLAEEDVPAGPSALTAEAGRALTPRYAAPEQIAGEAVSTRSDVYALGVLLHELLTGVLPHAGAQRSLAAMLDATLHTEPQPPSRVAPEAQRAALRGDLDTLVLKALRRNPAERYGSADRFAEDIRRYLAHRPIAARPAGLLHAARLFLRRHRAAGVAAGLGGVLACGFGATAWHQHRMGVEERLRADAVRNFMFDLVDDAEADEAHPGAEPTGRQMVLGAVRRAQQGYADQPRLRGELLAELGHMLGRLGDAAQAAGLLRQAQALLESHAPDGDAALNKVRVRLADQALAQQQPATAAALAGHALRACSEGAECAKARLYAHNVLAKLALRQGRPDLALQHMATGAQEAEAGFGAGHPEAALAWLHLATAARQAGERQRARQALDHALQLARNALLHAADREDLARMQAVIDFDDGDYAAARQGLLHLLQGPVADPAQLWRLLGQVELSRGDAAAARQAAVRAFDQAAQAADTVETALAHQVHGRALVMQGLAEDGAAELEVAVQGLQQSGYAPGSMEVLRARRQRAEARLAAGDRPGSLRELRAVAAAQLAAGAPQEVERALTLEAIGCALRQAGEPAAALAAYREAGVLLDGRLLPAHPLRRRNLDYQRLASRQGPPLFL